jgi:hypothetical protein
MRADQDGTGLLAQIRRISPEKFADLLRICGLLLPSMPGQTGSSACMLLLHQNLSSAVWLPC